MKKRWIRLCSLILVIVMVANTLPLNVWAEQSQSSKTAASSNVSTPESESNVKPAKAQVMQELVDKRTEYTKEFLLDNGLTMAVVYGSAVHYENDGEWKDIDNTLKTKADGTITNTAGVWDVVFPQQISGSNHISITKDGYTLSFGMAGELRQQGNLEIMSAGEDTVTQAANSKEQSAASTEAVRETEAPETTPPATTLPEVTVPETTVPETTEPETTIPETTEPEPVVAAKEASESAAPETTVPVATVSEDTTPETSAPVETASEESVPKTSNPEESEPEATVPEVTEPEATEPETTAPEATEPETTVPTETVKVEETVTETVSNELTAMVTIGGKAQTFAVSPAKTVRGSIQAINHSESLAEVEYSETVLTKNVSQLRYGDVYTNTDIQYDLKGNQVKESIILESYDSKLRGYRYTLNVGDLIPVINDDNSIHFFDKEKENVVMTMPAPFLVDNDLKLSEDVQVSLTQNGSTYTLIYLLPQDWLASEDRAWPVILDPAVVADLKDKNTHDITVLSARPSESKNTRTTLQLGYSTNDKISRAYLKFIELPELTAADVIINAQFSIKKIGSVTTAMPVTVHKVTETWNVSGLCWNNKPDYDPTIEDYSVVKGAARYYWDVTDIARDWYTGDNTGLMVKAIDSIENSGVSTNWKEFYSSDYGGTSTDPWLTITYRNNNGLESYWDYTSSSAGRAGAGHINQYTGNLVWVHDDIGFGGNRMPVSISHVYNANDNTITTFGMGTGWRTNFNQRVYQWSTNTNYYIWEDGDGTKHYFLKESTSTYKDEDGLELTLKTNGSGTKKYSITDKNGNVSYFDTNGRLTFQVNNQKEKSEIAITYTATSGYLISTITDGAGRKYELNYGSNNLLSQIKFTGKGTDPIASVSYGYTNGNLTSVTYEDGEQVTFTYGTNNLLTAATDIDGYALKYEYNTTTAGQPNRVSKVSEFDGTTAGGELNFEYAHNQTTLTDHNGNVQILQFNDLGNTVSVQDGEGHAQYAKYAKNNSSETGKGNQLKASSKLQNTVANLLTDTSFESSTLWTAASGTRSIASSGYLGSKSLQVVGGRVNSDTFTVASGESCTFSAYVKTTTDGASLALYENGNAVATQSIPNTSGWTRVEVNYTNSSSSTKTLSAALQCASGQTVYMDCVQLEKSPTASRYNLIQNGDFSVAGSPADSWTGTNTGTSDIRATVSPSAAPQLDTNVMQLTGSITGKKSISQTVPVSGVAGDTYVVAGWAQADSVPLNTDAEAREFGVRIVFNNTDNTKTTAVAQFNCDTNTTANWQYSAAAGVAEKAYSSITVEVAYDYNANTAYFDGIQLYKEEFSQSYAYDDDGNVVSVIDLQKQETKYEYDTNNNLTKQILPNNTALEYTYDAYHNVKTAKTDTGLTYTFEYDDYGNNEQVSITNEGITITSSAVYSDDHNRLVKAIDATGKETEYSYDENTNVLNWVKYPEDTPDTDANTKDGTITRYTYDSMYRMATAAATTDTGLALSAEYEYTDDLLTSIKTGNIGTAESPNWNTIYTFNYGNFALRSSVKIGSRTLANYTYTSRNNYLDTLAYGNGDSVKYTYDQQGRVTKQTYEDGATVTYRYDNDGALATVADSATGVSTTYYYDFIDRMMKYVETGSGYSHSVGYAYDTINNLTQMVETINGTARTTSYTYDDDNRVTSVTGGSTVKSYTYDTFGRNSHRETKQGNTVMKNEWFFFTAPTGATTSGQVSQHRIDTTGFDKTYTYTYDDNGNILTVSDGTNTTSYVYDSANQLIRENNQIAGKSWTWSYDNAGNILAKKEYAYTTGTLGTTLDTINYAYGDSSWGDLLTQYDGLRVITDEIGNPLRGYGRSYTWEHGRELAEIYVDSDFAITKQPEYSEGLLGDVLYFTVEAVGTNLSYRWQVSTDGGKNWENSSVGGYNTASMYMYLRDNNNGYLYRCKVTDGSGNVLVSEPVALVRVPIHITQQPEDFYGTYGDMVNFSIAAEGDGLTYQWQVSTNGGSSWGNSSAGGYNTPAMFVTLAEHNPGYLYRCKVTDSSGNVAYSEPGEIHADPVAVTKQPEDFVGELGDVVHFSIEAYGEGLTYQWQSSVDNGKNWYASSANGYNTASLSVPLAANNPGYLYRCKVTDGSGNVVYSEPGEIKVPQVRWKNTYNADGLRTQRTDGYTTYNYVYNGDKLSQLTVGNDVLNFFYDASGTPMSFSYNGSNYYYITTIQGDVIRILDESGSVVAYYRYDAWGKLLDSGGAMADINPIRYRGYVYDQEYGLYYLQSRYYNPETSRFLNADAFTATGQGLLGNNMFVYCNNCPVIYADIQGFYCQRIISDTYGTSGMPVSTAGVGGGGAATLWLLDLLEDLFSMDKSKNGKTDDGKSKDGKNGKKGQQPNPPDVKFPGNDPTKAPDGYVWKGPDKQGGKRGGYKNPNGKDSWHPDLNHPDGVDPHWDYNDEYGFKWRVFPNKIEFVGK